MTALDALRFAISDTERHLAALRAALAALEDGPEAGTVSEPCWISTKEAMGIAKVGSESTVYRWVERHGIGRKSLTGRMQIDERKLRALLRGEFGDAAAIMASAPRVRVE